MSEAAAFSKRAADVAADQAHRHKIARSIGNYDDKVSERRRLSFRDWETARRHAEAVKAAALTQLPELLERIADGLAANGVVVHWAETAADARDAIGGIMAQRNSRSAIKAKSMITEEIELNSFLAGQGIRVLESDLGELIVQLAGEKPYHIVTPAMHKSRQEIGQLFAARLGIPYSDDPAVLTAAARSHLRQGFIEADVGFTGANFLVAEPPAIVMTENEGNGRLCMALPPVHIVIAGIEKVLPCLQDLALFLPLLAASGTGQSLTGYNSIVRGPRQAAERDGPDEMHLILVDNGRSRLYADPGTRDSLRCIRCGACLNACPVYRTIGGHSYGTAYQGPIGAVITPQLRGLGDWQHLAQASSLCGACTSVCPVGIDLHHLLLENRRQADAAGATPLPWAAAIRVWAWTMSSRERLELAARMMRAGHAPAQALFPGDRELPLPAAESFASWWQSHEQQS